MMSGLSRRSVPAKINSLAVPEFRNFSLRPVNHSVQKGWVVIKSVIHFRRWVSSGSSSAGIERRADSLFRNVSDWRLMIYFSCYPSFIHCGYLHRIASSLELNDFGLEFNILVIEVSASIAEPSTTSITVTPIMFFNTLLHATLTTTDPPIL